MYACLCRAVTDRSVRDAVAAGASTVSQVRATCGAGTGCGGCLPSLRRLLRECLGTVPACSGNAVLDSGLGFNLAPTCSANCAESVGGAGEPLCRAGLGEHVEPVYEVAVGDLAVGDVAAGAYSQA